MLIEPVYTRQCKETKIMLYLDGDTWEVYYKRDGYPFMFAFGYGKKYPLDIEYVFELAEANIDNYSSLFD